jgi:prepilin-type N-terminal cleavage/methylation domain-containing protein
MNRRAAFTLIELLIVVAIIAALVGVALPYYQEYVKETRITKAKHELDIIKQALIKYDTMEDKPFASNDLTKLLGRYLQDLPRDPWGRAYEVEVASGLVRSLGPDHLDPKDDFIVYYKPPLALLKATWIDSDHNSLITASDAIILDFSRFLQPGLPGIRMGNLEAASATCDLLFSPDVNITVLDAPLAHRGKLQPSHHPGRRSRSQPACLFPRFVDGGHCVWERKPHGLLERAGKWFKRCSGRGTGADQGALIMAKTRRTRNAAPAAGITPPVASVSAPDLEFLPPPIRAVVRYFLPRPGDAPASLDVLDWVLFLGVLGAVIIVPFLYSRETTENFLTPKEFTAKIALGFLGAVLCLRAIGFQKAEFARSRLDLPLALFFGWGAMSVAWNYNVASAVRDLRGTFLILLLVPLVLNTVKMRWQAEILLWGTVIAGVATAGLGIMESYNWYFRLDPNQGWVFAREEIFAGRIDFNAWYIPLFPQLANKDYSIGSIVSTFGNRNYLGTFLMFVAFVPISFYFYYRSYVMKAISLGVFGYLAFGLYITRCRAALIGLLFGFGFVALMIFLLDRRWRLLRRNAAFFLCVIVIAGAGFSLATRSAKSESMLDKINYTFTMSRSASNTYERVWVWYATFRNFAPSPLKWIFGAGFGSYKHFFPLQEADTFSDDNKETFTPVTFRQAHNDWLQLVSELGLIGMGLFLFLLYRFFSMIYGTIRRDVWGPTGQLTGEHVLAIGLGGAMVSQLTAAGPDFPFHRIETAYYAVVFLAIIPVLTDTTFFRRPLPIARLPLNPQQTVGVALVAVFASLLAIHHEVRCWQADELVRAADAMMRTNNPQYVLQAKDKLAKAIQIDPLPGDPYLKMSTILEMENKAPEALDWAEKAWRNINFNARSTYHSVVFRRMHILYHLMGDRKKAFDEALLGQYLTCSEARSIYYFYLGKIALELSDIAKAEWALERAMKFPAFATQAAANLAVVKATTQKWSEALALAASISAGIGDTDPTMLDIVGISASNLGQHATAEAALRKAITLNPQQPVYKRDMGIALLRANRLPEARSFLEEAVAMPQAAGAVKAEAETLLASMTAHELNLGKSFIVQGQRDAAIQVLQHLAGAKVVDEPVRQEVQSLLKSLVGALPAEANPAPGQTAPAQPPVPAVLQAPPAPAPSPAIHQAPPQEAPAPQVIQAPVAPNPAPPVPEGQSDPGAPVEVPAPPPGPPVLPDSSVVPVIPVTPAVPESSVVPAPPADPTPDHPQPLSDDLPPPAGQ